VHRTVEIHAWLLAALLVGAVAMLVLFVVMLRVHAGDVAYIAHVHRPVIVVPAGSPPVVSS
jgi:NADH:ubiquinone oxidoreductase subunit 6 (subunit J)